MIQRIIDAVREMNRTAKHARLASEAVQYLTAAQAALGEVTPNARMQAALDAQEYVKVLRMLETTLLAKTKSAVDTESVLAVANNLHRAGDRLALM